MQSLISCSPLWRSLLLVLSLQLTGPGASAKSEPPKVPASASELASEPASASAPQAVQPRAPAASASESPLDEALKKAVAPVAALVAVLVVIASIAVPLVNLVTALLDARRRFHHWHVSQWLGLPFHPDGWPFGWDLDATLDPREAQLLELAIGNRTHRQVLYGQESGKLMAQLEAASRVALSYPDQYDRLVQVLTFCDLARSGYSPDDDLSTIQDPQTAAPDRAAARERLGNFAKRRLDALQMKIEYWWARLNQLAAMGVSVGLCFWAMSVMGSQIPWHQQLFIGVVGGLLAPFLSDLSKALSAVKVRSK